MKLQNLTPKEWGDIHLQTNTPKEVAMAVIKNRLVPWSKTMLLLTDRSEEILDLGSGTGIHSAFLAHNSRKVTLLDFSQENLNFSYRLFQILGLSGRFFKSDMTNSLPFEDNSFDVVFSIGVLEYFSDEEIKHVLQEAFRVSRKRVIIMTPNASSVAYRIGRWYTKITRRWKWGGERAYYSLFPYFKSLPNHRFFEFTVGVKQSIEFLDMFDGLIKKSLIYGLRLKDDSTPAYFRQGFVLFSMCEKLSIER